MLLGLTAKDYISKTDLVTEVTEFEVEFTEKDFGIAPSFVHDSVYSLFASVCSVSNCLDRIIPRPGPGRRARQRPG